MTNSKLVQRAAVAAMILLLGGCSPGEVGGGGSGGAGQAGAKGSGGNSSSSGGATGSGGGTSSSGGTSVPGSGGRSASGGATATGGATGSGGANATGGTGGSNTSGTGGTTSGSGGTTGTGGRASNPDAGATGGSSSDAGVGGSTGSGGSGNATRSQGCGKTTTKPNPDVQQTMTVGGTTRYYLLYIPTGYDASKAMPLVYGFHGRGQNNVWAGKDSGLGMKKQTNNTAILVFPQGSGDAPGTAENWGDGSLNSSWGTSSSGADMTFLDMLHADVISKWCVDETKVFATGFSMGGMMANGLGCYRGERFRGIAPIEGLNSTNNCTTKGTAALVQHDKNDSVVAYSQGQAAAESFRTINGCTATTANASGYSGCVAYQGCREGFPVLLCSTTGVDHHIPAAGPSNVWMFFTSLMK